MKTIAVFGSSVVQPGSAEYQDAQAVGRLLAENAYTVVTGGYEGVMAAASQGAAEAGGHVLGVTMRARSKLDSERQVNPWVKEAIPHDSMRTRLYDLVEISDGYVVMPGGIGTLQELAEAWQLMRIADMAHKPIIAYGPFWQAILTPLLDSIHIPDPIKALVSFANTPDDVVRILQRWKVSQA